MCYYETKFNHWFTSGIFLILISFTSQTQLLSLLISNACYYFLYHFVLFPSFSLMTSYKFSNNTLRIPLASLYRKLLKQRKYQCFMKIKFFVFSLEAFWEVKFHESEVNDSDIRDQKFVKLLKKWLKIFQVYIFLSVSKESCLQFFLNTSKIEKFMQKRKFMQIKKHLLPHFWNWFRYRIFK